MDKLCASLQQQQAAVNQGLPATASAGVSEAAKPAGAPKRKGLAGLLRASWHDIQQVRLEACVEEREKELSASADQTPEVCLWGLTATDWPWHTPRRARV